MEYIFEKKYMKGKLLIGLSYQSSFHHSIPHLQRRYGNLYPYQN